MSSRFGSRTDSGIIRDFIESYDGDAANYFAANTAITSSADKNAINDFYLGLKSDGIYTKIKAMYLPIWGSAASSKWNLINNRSFDLSFSVGGMTFTSGGMLPNGASAYANTQLIPSSAFAVDHNKHMSFYSRTNAATGSASSSIGSSNSTSGYCRFTIRGPSNQRAMVYGGTNGSYVDTETNSLGFYLGNRSSSTASQFYKNGSLIGNGNATNSTTSNIPQQLLICAAFDVSSILYYDNKQCAFASIGDSLTSTEVTNFSNRVNTLLAYFGINTYPVVSDADAQAYINANDAITSQSDANAINTFFTGLKADGIYTKIKAMYLPIWGTSTSSKWNLINNRSFDLSFSVGGMTFTSGGMTSNGTSGYANTNLIPSSFYSTNMHLSFYSRTSTIGNVADMGSSQIVVNTNYSQLAVARTSIWGQTTNGLINYLSQANALGFFIGQKVNDSSRKVFRNGVVNNSTTTTDSNPLPNKNIYIACLNDNGTAAYYSSKQCSFASIGDGLTDAEASNFYTRVNTLMTYFGINV